MICTESLSGLINNVQTAQTELVLPPLWLRLSTPRWSERTTGAGAVSAMRLAATDSCRVDALLLCISSGQSVQPTFPTDCKHNTRCSEMAGWAIDLCPSAGCWLAVNAGNKECFQWLVQQSQCVQHQNQTAALRPASLRARDYQTHYSASPAGLCVRTQRWTEFSRTMNKSPAHRSPELLLCSHSSWEQCWENHVLHLCFSLVMQKELHVLRIWSIHSASTKLTNQQPLTKAPSINSIFLSF